MNADPKTRARSLQFAKENFDPAELLENAREEFRQGNPWLYVELQWGVALTGEEYAGDVNERAEWDSGKWGKFFVLEQYQRELVDAVSSPVIREIGIKGASGTGKGASSSLAIVAYYDCWPDAAIVVTRDTYKTAVAIMWSEIKKWWANAWRVPPGELLGDSVEHEMRTESGEAVKKLIRIANPVKDEGFSGLHGSHVMFVFDEATAVPTSKWNMADTQVAKLIAIGNPRFPHGRFRDLFRIAKDPDVTQVVVGPSGLRKLITAAGLDASNVRMRRLFKPVAPQGGIEVCGHRYKAGELISQEHLPHVRPVVPGQIDLNRYLGITSNADANFVRYMGFGIFPDSDREFSLFPPASLDACVAWWRKWQELNGRQWLRSSRGASRRLAGILPVTAFGLDVARSIAEGDETVLAAGSRRGVRALHAVSLGDVMSIARWVLETVRKTYGVNLIDGAHPVAVDMTGVGAGLGDYLRSLGVHVVEVFGNGTPDDAEKYGNVRAEMYGLLADRMDPDGAFWGWAWLERAGRSSLEVMGVPFALPNDEKLMQELSLIETLRRGPKQRIFVTPKDGVEIIDRTTDPVRVIRPLRDVLKRSPDRADACGYMMLADRVRRSVNLDSWLDMMP